MLEVLLQYSDQKAMLFPRQGSKRPISVVPRCLSVAFPPAAPGLPQRRPPAPEGMDAVGPLLGCRLQPCFLKHVQPSSPGAGGNVRELKCGNDLLAALLLPRGEVCHPSDTFRGSQPGQRLRLDVRIPQTPAFWDRVLSFKAAQADGEGCDRLWDVPGGLQAPWPGGLVARPWLVAEGFMKRHSQLQPVPALKGEERYRLLGARARHSKTGAKRPLALLELAEGV